MTHDSLEFHIRSEDLFGTFATEIDLLRQDAHRHGYTRKHDAALKRLRDDLMILQSRCRIVQVAVATRNSMQAKASGNSDMSCVDTS